MDIVSSSAVAERRSATRHELDMSVGFPHGHGRVVDISATGLRAVTAARFAPGDSVMLTLRLPARFGIEEVVSIDIVATVVRVSRPDAAVEELEVAVRFEDIRFGADALPEAGPGRRR